MTGPASDARDGLEPEDVATDDGANVIQGEHGTELFDALEDTFHGLGRKKGERLHDYALRVRLVDQIQGFLLLRRANLGTQARIAIMTLACKRFADKFLRDPKEHDVHKSHTVCVSQAKEARVTAEKQEGDTDVETALAALNEDCDTDLEETDAQEILLAYKESRQRGEQRVNRGYRPVTGRTSGGNLVELRVDST